MTIYVCEGCGAEFKATRIRRFCKVECYWGKTKITEEKVSEQNRLHEIFKKAEMDPTAKEIFKEKVAPFLEKIGQPWEIRRMFWQQILKNIRNGVFDVYHKQKTQFVNDILAKNPKAFGNNDPNKSIETFTWRMFFEYCISETEIQIKTEV